MEGIILLLISLVVGSFLKGKDKKEAPKNRPKPFTAQPQEGHQNPVGKLKEMYKEIQEELQSEAEKQRQADRQMVEPEPSVSSNRAEMVAVTTRNQRPEKQARPDRHTVRQRQKEQRQQQQSPRAQENLMPKTEEDIMKGVIFSEIFGPPKSRR